MDELPGTSVVDFDDHGSSSYTPDRSNVIEVENTDKFAVASIDGHDRRYWDGTKTHCWWIAVANAKLFNVKAEAVTAAVQVGGTAVRVNVVYTVKHL